MIKKKDNQPKKEEEPKKNVELTESQKAHLKRMEEAEK